MASIRITPSKQEAPTVEVGVQVIFCIIVCGMYATHSNIALEESLDLVEPHEWSKMTVFVKTGSDGRVGKSPLYSVLSIL